jgi:hypothetical protein
MGIYCKGKRKKEHAVGFEVLEKLGAVINIRKKEIIFEE